MSDWTARLWQPRDVVMILDGCYRVTGVYLGALGQVSMIGLEPMTERPGRRTTDDGFGPPVTEMLVPLNILNAAVASDKARHYRDVI